MRLFGNLWAFYSVIYRSNHFEDWSDSSLREYIENAIGATDYSLLSYTSMQNQRGRITYSPETPIK